MAYKIFTNGSPLPASDLNTYLMNQSVMVFADSTARSASLTAPTEGMVTYLEDTNKLEARIGSSWVAVNSPITTQGDLIIGDGSGLPSRLGIGTNGQVLQSNGTTASWATPAGGGGFTLLSTTTLSGSTTTISSISQAYQDLFIEIVGINLNSSALIEIRPRTGTTNLTSQELCGVRAGVVENNVGLQPGNQLRGSDTFNFFGIRISNYAESSNNYRKQITYAYNHNDNGLVRRRAWLGGIMTDSNNGGIDGLQLFTGSSFNGGTVRIWGIK